MARHEEPDGDRVAKRLAKIAGHAKSLQKFWDEGRECDEMLTQISAVRSALDQAAKAILQNHIEHGIGAAMETGESGQLVRDVKKALDRLI